MWAQLVCVRVVCGVGETGFRHPSEAEGCVGGRTRDDRRVCSRVRTRVGRCGLECGRTGGRISTVSRAHTLGALSLVSGPRAERTDPDGTQSVKFDSKVTY